jgi:hypothetical protein
MPGLFFNNDDNDSDVSSRGPNLITNVDYECIANIFCFGAFADKNTGRVYNNCTGKFPFMSLDWNVCFFMMYHYKTTNAIFATLIPDLDSKSISAAYVTNFEYLVSKGYTPKINIMDN